jgi:MFS family permease
MGNEPKSGLGNALRAFRHRDFSIFWTSALLSNTGSWLQSITVPYVLFELTGSETWVGMATFAQFLPSVLMSPAGGSLADRYDRRRLLVVTQSLLAVAAAGLWAFWALGGRSPAMLLVFVAITGTLGGLNIPGWQAFVPALVPREDLLSAVTLNSLQFNAARALGPAVAGAILYTQGPAWTFLLNAMSFGFVLAALVTIRPQEAVPVRRSGGAGGFVEALRYTARQPGITAGILIALAVGFLGNPIIQFAVVYAKEVYRVGDLGYGFLVAGMGIGAAVAAPLVSGFNLRRSTVVRLFFPAYGLACAVFGFSTTYWLGLVALIVAGAGFLAVVSASNTAVQIIVADRLRGRVLAVRVMSFTLAFAIGGLIQGALAEGVGLRQTVTGAGLALTALATYLALEQRRLAHLDDEPDPGDEPLAAAERALPGAAIPSTSPGGPAPPS